MRVTYDRSTDSAYISLRSDSESEAAERQIFHQPHTMGLIVLVFDEKHRLVGLEVLDARKALPPDVLEGAGESAPR